jgi:hypothetical protein
MSHTQSTVAHPDVEVGEGGSDEEEERALQPPSIGYGAFEEERHIWNG